MNMRLLIRLAGIFVPALMFGTLLYITIATRAEYVRLQTQYSEMSSTPVLYGTVESIDAQKHILEVLVPDRYDARGPLSLFAIDASRALVQHLTLIPKDNVYIALSEARAATLEDIPRGALVAIFTTYQKGTIIANRIYFGNPL